MRLLTVATGASSSVSGDFISFVRNHKPCGPPDSRKMPGGRMAPLCRGKGAPKMMKKRAAGRCLPCCQTSGMSFMTGCDSSHALHLSGILAFSPSRHHTGAGAPILFHSLSPHISARPASSICSPIPVWPAFMRPAPVQRSPMLMPAARRLRRLLRTEMLPAFRTRPSGSSPRMRCALSHGRHDAAGTMTASCWTRPNMGAGQRANGGASKAI